MTLGHGRQLVEEVALRVLGVLDRHMELHEPACCEATLGSDAVVVGAGAGTPPDPAILVTRTAALFKIGCFETGSQAAMVSSFAARSFRSRSVRSCHDP
jgi:hypothetical protein